MEQIDFDLPKIDIRQTKEAVEEKLAEYRNLLLRTKDSELPTINTQDYSFESTGKSNLFNSVVENMAIKNADYEIYRKRVINRMQLAVNRLNYWHRAIVIRRYMTDDSIYDYEVYNNLGLSERTYRRKKSEALFKLAKILDLEVFEKKESDETVEEEVINELRTANT